MDELVNEKVTHKKFGDGTILEANGGYLNIKFEVTEDVKEFKYPDSFDRFIKFHNTSLQDEVDNHLNNVKAKKEALEEIRRKELAKFDEERKKERIEKIKKQRKAAKTKSEKETAPAPNGRIFQI